MENDNPVIKTYSDDTVVLNNGPDKTLLITKYGRNIHVTVTTTNT